MVFNFSLVITQPSTTHHQLYVQFGNICMYTDLAGLLIRVIVGNQVNILTVITSDIIGHTYAKNRQLCLLSLYRMLEIDLIVHLVAILSLPVAVSFT